MRSSKLSLLAAVLLLAPVSQLPAQSRDTISAALDAPVEGFGFPPPGRPAGEIFDTIAREYSIPVVLDPEVKGDVSFRVYGTRLRGVLDAICQPRGWHYEIVSNPGGSYAYLAIRRYVTRSYSVDYLQLTSTSSSSASVSLAGSSSGGNTNGSTSGTGTSGTNGSGSESGGGGSSSVSLSTNSTVEFWERFENDAKSFVDKEESLVVNRFAGLVQLRASLRTHAQMEAYIQSIMKRVKRSATVTVQIVRVDLNQSSKLGVDWRAAQFAVGGDGRNQLDIGGTFTNAITGVPTSNTGSNTGSLSTVGSVALPGNTFQTVLSAGKVSALISALKEQGDVTVSNRAFVYALNNQMGLAQVSLDEPTFTRETEIDFTTTNTTGGSGTVPTSRTNFTKEVVSIGNVFEITPQIDDNLITTVSIAPSLTDLRGEKLSPDGQSSALRVGVRRFRSTVILRNGETALLGGFIEEQNGTSTRSIPGLGSIPGIGRAFRTEGKINTRSEFVILVSVEAKDAELVPPTQVEVPAADQSGGVALSLLERSRSQLGEASPQLRKAVTLPAPPESGGNEAQAPVSENTSTAPSSGRVELLGGQL
jgi:type II secretory pathway component GspD/PulD (secretin)